MDLKLQESSKWKQRDKALYNSKKQSQIEKATQKQLVGKNVTEDVEQWCGVHESKKKKRNPRAFRSVSEQGLV